MPVSYDKLWKLLIDKKMNRTERGGRNQLQCSGEDGKKRIYLNGKPL